MTPNQPPPFGSPSAPPQSWFGRNWKLLAGLGCAGAMVCCGGFSVLAYVGSEMGPNPVGNGSARVDCGTPGPGGVDCQVKRTSGGGGLRPCWDLEITCANGGVMVGNACGSLAAGQSEVTVNMPVSSFSNQDGCDAPKTGAVKQLIVHPE